MSKEYEARYVIEHGDDAYRVNVSKRGGGVVGHDYKGFWDAEVRDMDTGTLIWWTGTLDSERIHTGTARTHSAVATIALRHMEENW